MLLVDRTTRWKTTVRNRALGYLSCLLHSTAVRLRALSNAMYYLHPLGSSKKKLHLKHFSLVITSKKYQHLYYQIRFTVEHVFIA
jgi:hypothetical protein